MLTVTPNSIDVSALLKSFESKAFGAGAIVSFSGLVRADASGGVVDTLFLQAYSPMTENGIEAAIREAQDRWPISDACVVHRVGEMAVGETIVFVATASSHRRDAFESADYLMDYLKTRAVFWKRERTDQGEKWIEPRAEDYSDAKRWL